MRHRIVAAMLAFAALGGPGLGSRASAQAADQRPDELAPIWLPRPEYPAIARAARLQGNVEVAVAVAADGRVASATTQAGHALLRAAALEAARETHFVGRQAGAPVLSYSLIYTFALGDGLLPPRPPSTVTSAGAHMTTVTDVDVMSCGPAPLAVPGPKCLYLWRCGRDWDWWRRTESARGAKCLWLWGCAENETD